MRIEKGGQILRHLSKGEAFGEAALIAKSVRAVSVIADEDVIICPWLLAFNNGF